MKLSLLAALLTFSTISSFASVVEISGINPDGTKCHTRLELDDSKRIIAFSFKGTVNSMERRRAYFDRVDQDQEHVSRALNQGDNSTNKYSNNFFNDGFTVSFGKNYESWGVPVFKYLKVKVNMNDESIKSVSFSDGGHEGVAIDYKSFGKCIAK